MNYMEMMQERQKRLNDLVNELQRLEVYKKQLEEEIIRLQGELRLLNELMQKESGKSDDNVIGKDDIQ